ncbi:MAG: hypothetical protein MUP53_09560, partial [Bacteroidales bacterium]|nr:hypothetical protein [Bacteroidales bacterium]
MYSQTIEVPWLKYLNVPAVDSLLNSLSVSEMIAQSIWVEAWGDDEKNNFETVRELVTRYGIGGVIFFEGSQKKQINYT